MTDLLTLLAAVDLKDPETVKPVAAPLREWLDEHVEDWRDRVFYAHVSVACVPDSCREYFGIHPINYDNWDSLQILFSLDALRAIRRPGWQYEVCYLAEKDWTAQAWQPWTRELKRVVAKEETAAILMATIKSWEAK